MQQRSLSILHISDTHNRHRAMGTLPAADVLVHSGDITMNGTEQEVLDFLEWFCDLPHRHKLFIAGNHDSCLYGATIEGLPAGCHYLCYSSVMIEGICFYGVPMFSEDRANGCYETQIAGIPLKDRCPHLAPAAIGRPRLLQQNKLRQSESVGTH